MQLSNFHQNNLGRQISSRNQLVGKVVLLIGNDTAVLKTLTMQLAQKGADIALFCRKLSAEALQTIKTQVEAFGRRFLILSEEELQINEGTKSSADRLIKKIVSALGHLDIFIDLSAPQQNLLAAKNESEEREVVQPSWQIRQAIFTELANGNGN